MIPTEFDEQFLLWFRKHTEKAWRKREAIIRDEFQENNKSVPEHLFGMRWLNGLQEQEIREIEQRWHVHFPPDYRLFLSLLHAMDKKQIYFDEEEIGVTETNYRTYLNWQTNTKEIEERYEDIIEGMMFDVRHNLWPKGWGEKPATSEEQEAKVRRLVAAAPPIIPVISNCFLLTEPYQYGNPVLSISETDIIVYSPDLYTLFLQEIAMEQEYSGRPSRQITAAIKKRKEIWRERLPQYRTIPFWGQFV